MTEQPEQEQDLFEIDLQGYGGLEHVTLTQEETYALARELSKPVLPTVIMIGDVPCEPQYAVDICNMALEYFGIQTDEQDTTD